MVVHASRSVQCMPGMAACTYAPVQVDTHHVTCIAKESLQDRKLLHTMWMKYVDREPSAEVFNVRHKNTK